MLKIYQALLVPLRFLLEMFSFLPPVDRLLAPRRGLLERWKRADLGENRIWVHVSSVGELEQVRPVLEILKVHGFSLLLSYFSSSVPKLVKDWGFVQFADFLPLDFTDEMEELMKLVKPRLLVLNRYDLWPNHLEAARRHGIPVVVVNASTPPLGRFGAFSLWIRRELFRAVEAWSFVDGAAAASWEPNMRDRAKGLVAGDPRVDRALARVEKALREGKTRDKLAGWRKEPFCLVAGSTWSEDEDVLIGAWKGLGFPRSLVIVPHEPEEGHLKKLERKIKAAGLRSARYSDLQAGSVSAAEVLVVDQRGILAELYGLGNLAYVGGGFGRQIHSIVEPSAHGLPMAFGPRFHRSPEAVTLTATGSAFALPGRGAGAALERWISEMARPGEARDRAEEALRVFVQIHRGAGERVASFLLGLVG